MTDSTNTTAETPAHLWEWQAEDRIVPSDSPWVEREPTGMMWCRCSCGVRIEDPDGAPLPKADVLARLNEHLEQAGVPEKWRPRE